ncbi:LPS export ABC transporter periplasmic protein LptC [Alphaproteobacteria bacterium KMM 3653]|uniref:LPS export ABC transporter periplasmic protein LptC n=1 Tax=Harenicola maris TaxID=2841044 RepID=A0AAP2G8L3_9RHOB|nr:LPS export ABC transporter periplasmic protein LptC [Harenicola maris]
MSAYDNPYSRFVAWSKIVLPLLALGLLSTMFLISRGFDASGVMPFAEVDVKELAREQRISAPNYSGVTSDGSAISVAASTARPDQTDRDTVNATDLRAEVETLSGMVIELSSSSGQINTRQSRAVLDGGVTVMTSSGYRITTDKITTSLSETKLATEGPVEATGPGAKLSAGRMELTQSGEAGYQLIFQNGVQMVYTPQVN